MAVTIKDIADMAKVSTSTVSRVLNNNGFVKENTRKRINRIIKKHSYVPQESKRRKDPAPKNATPLRYHNFAIIWAGGLEASTGATAQMIMQGLSESASGFNATINMEFVPESGEISDLLNRRKLDGLFLNGTNFSDAFMEQAKKLPVIWLLQAGQHEFGDRIQPDHSAIGLLAYRHLRSRGCRRICCITCRDYENFYRYWKTREQAFHNAAAIDGVGCETVYMDYPDFTPPEIRLKAAQEVISRLKALKQLPDGIFITNSFGSPIYAELMSSGLPYKDMEIIAGDKEVCGDYYTPEPVKIDIGTRDLGRMAVEAMIWRLHHPDWRRLTYMLEPSLIIPEQ